MRVTDAAKQGRSQSVIEAVENGSVTDLQLLLRKVCQDYHTIKKHDGHLELVRFLLSVGAKAEVEMVCEAARGGHEKLINALVDGGLPSDLFVAAALGDAAAVQGHLALEASSVTHFDSQGTTPLHYCCASSIWRNSSATKHRFLETSSVLLSAGANVHATGAYHGLAGVTPLFYVGWTGGHPEIAKQLLEHGAEITQNISFAAIGHFQRHGEGNYQVAEALLAHGFDVNHCEDRTALHAFAGHEDSRGVSWLLEHGADVDARDSEGNTPLMAAAHRNNGLASPCRGRLIVVRVEPSRRKCSRPSRVKWQDEGCCVPKNAQRLTGF